MPRCKFTLYILYMVLRLLCLNFRFRFDPGAKNQL